MQNCPLPSRLSKAMLIPPGIACLPTPPQLEEPSLTISNPTTKHTCDLKSYNHASILSSRSPFSHPLSFSACDCVMPPRSHYYSNYKNPHNPRSDSPTHYYQSHPHYYNSRPSTHYRSRASSPPPKKHKRHNHRFTTSLHIFVALVLLDFIAETQLRTSARRLYQKYHPKSKSSPNLSPNLNQESQLKWQPQQSVPSLAQSPPATRRSKNPIIVSRPSTSSALSPVSPTSTPPGSQTDLLSDPHHSLQPHHTQNTDIRDKQLSLKSQLTTMLAWLPMETLEEILEVVMEIMAEGADAL